MPRTIVPAPAASSPTPRATTTDPPSYCDRRDSGPSARRPCEHLPRVSQQVGAGIHHYFENASDSEEMHIFWTYASVDATRTIVATGVTTRIDEEHGTAVTR